MTPVQAIIAKELRTAFVSPIVYVVGAVFLLIFGVLSKELIHIAGELALRQMQFPGATAQLNLNDLVFRPVFYWTGFFFLLVLLPILTMRSFAEERKLRTFELLMTCPIRMNEVIIGKFLALLLLYLGMLALTGIVPLILAAYSSFDWNPVLTGYLGLVLMGALFLAVGVLTSAMTENQIVAALLSFGLLFMLWLLGVIGANLGNTALGDTITYFSFLEHFDRLVRGLVDTKDLVYFFSGVVLVLFLTHRVVDSQRWK